MAPVFQIYRFAGDDVVWWRLVSPNGRGLARAGVPGRDVAEVRATLDGLPDRLPMLDELVRLTADYRWRWSLRDGGIDVAQGIGDQDRRVRCVHACRAFAALVPDARVDPVVATYRRAGQPAVLSRSTAARSTAAHRGDLDR
ncbi:hypothetical protein [Cellulomonas sp. P5_C6]